MAGIATFDHPTARSLPHPGPRGIPVLGPLPEILRDPLEFFVNTAREYGDVAWFNIGANRVVMLNNPRHIKHVFQDNHANYRKSRFYRFLKPVLGRGIFLAEGKEWVEQRRTLKHPFEGPQLARMVPEMAAATTEMLDAWERRMAAGDLVDVSADMMRLTLDAAMRTLLKVRLDNEHKVIYQALSAIQRQAEKKVWSVLPMPDAIPTPGNLEARQALAALNEIAWKIIDERRRNPREEGDLLTTLIRAYDTPEQRPLLRDQVVSMIISGHETTAVALGWTWYLLSKNPQVERRMHEEVRAVLAGAAPTFETLPNLEYTKMVFEEALRLYPPVWTISRDAVADDDLGDLRIPRGTTTMLCAYAVHRNPLYWDNAEGFDPDRFQPDVRESRERYAYFPFGGGPRVCLGNRFAMLEAPLILAMVNQRFRLDLVPGLRVEPEPMITLRPRHGIKMMLRPQVAQRLH